MRITQAYECQKANNATFLIVPKFAFNLGAILKCMTVPKKTMTSETCFSTNESELVFEVY